MDLFFTYLSEPFVQNALLASLLVAIMCGIIGPFVIMRNMAFAVHGTSELAFTGAAAGLLLGNRPVEGALIGSLLFAGIIGFLGVKEKERDSTIGVVLAFGLGLGVLFLSFYKGFATQATNILFGNIFGVSTNQLLLLLAITIGSMVTMVILYRPLLFSSIDPEVAEAKGVPIKIIGIIFLLILALAITQAAQIVGTLLVLSLAITPAAAAQQLSARPLVVVFLSILFALISAVGGLLVSLVIADGSIKTSVCVAIISFAMYVMSRLFALKNLR